MADTTDLKSVAGNSVWVRVPPSLPFNTKKYIDNLRTFRQVGKARVCKTLMRWFESNKVLQTKNQIE